MSNRHAAWCPPALTAQCGIFRFHLWEDSGLLYCDIIEQIREIRTCEAFLARLSPFGVAFSEVAKVLAEQLGRVAEATGAVASAIDSAFAGFIIRE